MMSYDMLIWNVDIFYLNIHFISKNWIKKCKSNFSKVVIVEGENFNSKYNIFHKS